MNGYTAHLSHYKRCTDALLYATPSDSANRGATLPRTFITVGVDSAHRERGTVLLVTVNDATTG